MEPSSSELAHAGSFSFRRAATASSSRFIAATGLLEQVTVEITANQPDGSIAASGRRTIRSRAVSVVLARTPWSLGRCGLNS